MITHAVQVLQVYELQNVVINNMGLNTQRLYHCGTIKITGKDYGSINVHC